MWWTSLALRLIHCPSFAQTFCGRIFALPGPTGRQTEQNQNELCGNNLKTISIISAVGGLFFRLSATLSLPLLTRRNRVGWKWFLFRYWLLSPWSIMQLLLSDVHGSVGVRTGGLWGAAVLGSSFSRSNSPALPGFRASVISKQDS